VPALTGFYSGKATSRTREFAKHAVRDPSHNRGHHFWWSTCERCSTAAFCH